MHNLEPELRALHAEGVIEDATAARGRPVAIVLPLAPGAAMLWMSCGGGKFGGSGASGGY